MSPDSIKVLVDVGQFLLSCGIGIWLYFDRRNDTAQARMNTLEQVLDERLDNLSTRVAKVEAHQENLVTHEDLGLIKQDVSSTKALLQSVKEQLDRIQNWLISNK